MNTYTIQPNESLSSIAKQQGVSLQDLIDLNHIQNPDKIMAGQSLLLPDKNTDSSLKIKILDLALEPIEGLEFKLSYADQTMCSSTDSFGWLPIVSTPKPDTEVHIEVKKVTGDYKKIGSVKSTNDHKIITIKSPKMKFEAPLKKDQTKTNPTLTTKQNTSELPKQKTISHVYEKGKPIVTVQKKGKWMFPLDHVPAESYKIRPRSFGSPRNGGKRKHAGCDLYAPVGTKIYAMADGIIKFHTPFYNETNQITIEHADYVIRYGEVKPHGLGLAEGLVVGSKVKQGEHIGYVGKLKFNNGRSMSMLHLEMYDKSASGPLTDRANKPYQRRKDLIDPTAFLDIAKNNLPKGN